MSNLQTGKMTNHRWTIVVMLFMATTVNYLDRQVLSLTWADFIAPEFHWTNSDYGTITGLFSIFYAVSMLFAGKFIDWMDTKKGFSGHRCLVVRCNHARLLRGINFWHHRW